MINSRYKAARHLSAMCAFAALVCGGCAVAHAQFPDKPVRLVVPFSPGGTNDIIGRILAEKMTPGLGQLMIVENRGGAATNIGTEFVARSVADGHTLLLGSSSSAANVTLYPQLKFDLRKDFAAIALVATTAQVLFVHPSLPVRSLPEFIRFARARPGQLSYASAGVAGPPHLAGALFNMLAGVELLHVPYKSGAEAVTAVISGQTSASFAGITGALPQIRSGRLRALGVTTARRVAAAPDLPTISEAGLKGYEMSGWIALLAPARTPPGVIDILNREALRALRLEETRQRLLAAGAEAAATTPPELQAFIHREIEGYARVIQAAGIRPE